MTTDTRRWLTTLAALAVLVAASIWFHTNLQAHDQDGTDDTFEELIDPLCPPSDPC